MKFLAPVGGQTSAYGILSAPNHKGTPGDIVRGKIWAGDVGCLDGPDYVKKINFSATIEWLKSMEVYRPRCLFIAGADIVGDALSTLDAYEEFYHYFNPWPVAYVAQNGAESLPIPANCAAVFIGGNTAWKCSMEAVEVIRRAQAMGKHIHIGRINWGRRYRVFRVLQGSEDFTCDGSRTRYDGTSKTLRAWHGYESQAPLLTI